MAVVVTIIEGERSGETLRFDALAVSVGRADQCSLVLPDRGISRHHCDLSIHEGELWLQDQGTTNGTQLNGVNVHRTRVSNGSEITIGPVRFRVLLEGTDGIDYKDLADYRGLIKGAGAPHRERIPIPHPSLRGGNRWVQPGMTLRRKRLIGAAAVVGLLGLTSVVVSQLGLVAEPEDLNKERIPVLRLETNQTVRSTIGYSSRSTMDVGAPDGAVFEFEHPPGIAVFTMDVASIDSARELEVRLNNKSLLFAPRTQQWLIGGISIVLPTALLQTEGNRLELVHRNADTRQESWGVRQVRLRHFAAPPPSLEEARQHFEMAKARHRSHRVHPHNLPAAVRLFRQSALLAHGLDPRPPLFEDALQRFAEAHKELTAEFRRSYLDAQRASQLEGKSASCRVLDATVRRFTDHDDWRYQRASTARRRVCSEALK